MNERPRKAAAGPPEGDALGELRDGFDEIYGNIEGFSKRAVGSLFDDDENDYSNEVYTRDEASTRDVLADKINDREHGRPSRTVGPANPPSPYGRDTDPDEDYAMYIRTAEKANRMEQEKHRVGREQAIIERDEKLSDISHISRRREEPEPIKRINIEEKNSYVPSKPNKPQNRGRRMVNVRNLAAVGAFLMLAVCALLTWQWLSAQSELSAANERLEGLASLESDVNRLNMANNELENIVARLENENLQLYEDIQALQAIIGGAAQNAADDNASGEGDAANEENNAAAETPTAQVPGPGDLPYTTFDAQGRRIYVIQPNDTVWSIAMRIFQDGNRVRDILEANNLTEEQARTAIHAGNILFIPD